MARIWNESMDAPIPTGMERVVLDGYEILGPIGQGGMGEVVLARQVSLDRLVAIKWLRPASGLHSSEWVERFRSEAALMAKLSHANILTVHDSGIDQGRPYLVLEYVEHGDLRHLFRTGSHFPISFTRGLLRQICDAVEYLHERKVIHRDLKPENILMKDGVVPKVSDFGIAVLQGQSKHSAGLGSDLYMAPEQRAGRMVDPRADEYALGCLAYELLTGEPPVGNPHPPSHWNAALDSRIDRVILMAMNESPEKRFPSVREFARELDEALAALEQGAPASGPTWSLGRGLLFLLMLVALLASLSLMVIRPWKNESGGPPIVITGPDLQRVPTPTEVITEDDLVHLWAYKLWLEQGRPDGEDGERLREPNQQQAEELVRGELQRLAYDIWRSRGSLRFEDPEAALQESERNWQEAHLRLKRLLQDAIAVAEQQGPQEAEVIRPTPDADTP